MCRYVSKWFIEGCELIGDKNQIDRTPIYIYTLNIYIVSQGIASGSGVNT